jgi:hydrogenase/urease accessory protein HupE
MDALRRTIGVRGLRARISEAATSPGPRDPCDGVKSRALDHVRLAPVFAALFWPAQAQAHSAVKTLGGFWAGVLHPLISLDQLGVLLALAIWIVWRSRPADTLVAVIPAGALLGACGAPGGDGAPLVMPAAMVLFGAMAAAKADLGNVWAEHFAAALGGVSVGIGSAIGAEDYSRILYALGVALPAASIAVYAFLASRHATGIPCWVEAGARSGAAIIAAGGIGLFAASWVGWDTL